MGLEKLQRRDWSYDGMEDDAGGLYLDYDEVVEFLKSVESVLARVTAERDAYPTKAIEIADQRDAAMALGNKQFKLIADLRAALEQRSADLHEVRKNLAMMTLRKNDGRR